MKSMVAFCMAIDKCKKMPELIHTIHAVYDVCSLEQKAYLYRMLKYLLQPIIPKEIYEDLLEKFNCEEEQTMTELIERMLQDIENTKQTAEKKGLKKTAINMLKRNMPLEDIADITGLSIEEIKKLEIA